MMWDRKQGVWCPGSLWGQGKQEKRYFQGEKHPALVGSRVSQGPRDEDLATWSLLDICTSSFSAMSLRISMNSASTDDFLFHTIGSDFSPGLHLSLFMIIIAERQQSIEERAWSVVSGRSGLDHWHLAVCPWRVTGLSKTQFPHL